MDVLKMDDLFDAKEPEDIVLFIKSLPDELINIYPYNVIQKEVHYATMIKWGFDCMYRRTPLGYYCGYIRIPASHILAAEPERIDNELYVHGGITYMKKIDDGSYIVGFDCAHYQDYVPYLDLAATDFETYNRLFGFQSGVYRDEEFVRLELTELALQLKKLI